MTYQSIEEPTSNQLDDAKESDSAAPVEFVVPAMSSVLVTPSGSVVATRPLVPAPPIVHRTTWGQPAYGTHYTNGTDDELLKYFIDLQTGCLIDPYTGKIRLGLGLLVEITHETNIMLLIQKSFQ
jgi:hypothetical protein